jgi:hypothetical protein
MCVSSIHQKLAVSEVTVMYKYTPNYGVLGVGISFNSYLHKMERFRDQRNKTVYVYEPRFTPSAKI